MRSVARGIAAAALATLVVAPPAAAQTTADPDAGFYRAEITGITPAVPGVTARVGPIGEWIEVTNAGPDEVVVLGYAKEPYLRITATGVQENERSSSAVLNQALFADLPTGTEGNNQPPVW